MSKQWHKSELWDKAGVVIVIVCSSLVVLIVVLMGMHACAREFPTDEQEREAFMFQCTAHRPFDECKADWGRLK